MELAKISLRERERAFLAGGTEVGKSTLGEALIVDFFHRYRVRGCRVLILDSKPRFRAEWEVSGRRAKRRYKAWSHGSTVPGSIVVHDPAELPIAWDTGAEVVVAQADTEEDFPALLACASQFYDESTAGRPQLLVVDEAMDFYRENGTPIVRRDPIRRTARSGRERGLGALLCSQRTRMINAQLMSELTKLYLFRLDYRDDRKRLLEMGAPPELLEAMPTREHEFIYWTKRAYRDVWGPYRLELPSRRRRAQAG